VQKRKGKEQKRRARAKRKERVKLNDECKRKGEKEKSVTGSTLKRRTKDRPQSEAS